MNHTDARDPEYNHPRDSEDADPADDDELWAAIHDRATSPAREKVAKDPLAER